MNNNSIVRDQKAHKFQVDACTSDMSTSYFGGKSPFPQLDQFIESIASTGNVSGCNLSLCNILCFGEIAMLIFVKKYAVIFRYDKVLVLVFGR